MEKQLASAGCKWKLDLKLRLCGSELLIVEYVKIV